MPVVSPPIESSLHRFGYLPALSEDYPEPEDFKTLYFKPIDMPVYMPFGVPVRISDGTILYTSQPQLTLLFPGLLYLEQPPDIPVGEIGGNFQEFLESWFVSRERCLMRYYVNLYNPHRLSWQVRKAVFKRPDISGKLYGKAVRNFALNMILDLDNTLYYGGAVSPPGNYVPIAPGEFPDENNLPLIESSTGELGEFGYSWGDYGCGPYSIGGYADDSNENRW